MLNAIELSEKGFSILKVIISMLVFSISLAALNSQKIFFLKVKKLRQNQKIEMPKAKCERKESIHFIFDFCNDMIFQQKGFTLIELIISIGLLSFTLAAVSSWALSSIKFTAKQKQEQMQYEKLEAASIFAQNLITDSTNYSSFENILISKDFNKSRPDSDSLSIRSFDSYLLFPSAQREVFCLKELNSLKEQSKITTDYWLALSSSGSLHLKASFKLDKIKDPRCHNQKSFSSSKFEVVESIFTDEKQTLQGNFFLIPITFSGTLFLSLGNTLKVYEQNKNYTQPIRLDLDEFIISEEKNKLILKNSKHSFSINIRPALTMSEKELFIIFSKLQNETA